MLLKTRPKFFFDIEEETQRPNRLACNKRSRNRKSLESDLAQPGPSSSSQLSSESTAGDSSGITKKLSVSIEESKAVEDAKDLKPKSRRLSASQTSIKKGSAEVSGPRTTYRLTKDSFLLPKIFLPVS